MKMTYSELSMIGRLRKISMCGPFSMFCKLIHQWKDLLSPVEVSVLLPLRRGFCMLLEVLLELLSPFWLQYFYMVEMKCEKFGARLESPGFKRPARRTQ